jgi:hypothetical protein
MALIPISQAMPGGAAGKTQQLFDSMKFPITQWMTAALLWLLLTTLTTAVCAHQGEPLPSWQIAARQQTALPLTLLTIDNDDVPVTNPVFSDQFEN